MKWYVAIDKGNREARTKVTIFVQNRRSFRIDVWVSTWHPNIDSPNYPKALLKAIQSKLFNDLPVELEKAGLRASVRYMPPGAGLGQAKSPS